MARYRQQGPVSLEEVAEFFGENRDDTHSLDNYYRGGGIVPSTGPTGGQAAVHNILVGNPNEFIIYLTGSSGNYTGQTYTYTNAGPTTFSFPESDTLYRIPGSDTFTLAADTDFKGDSFEANITAFSRVQFSSIGFTDGTRLFGGPLINETGPLATSSNREYTLTAGEAFFASIIVSGIGDDPVTFTAEDITFETFESDVATVEVLNVIPSETQSHNDSLVSIPAGLTTDAELSQALLTSLNNRRTITDNFTVTRELTMVPEIDPNNNVWIVRLVGTNPNATYPTEFIFDAPAGDFSNSRVVTRLGTNARSDGISSANEEFYIYMTGESTTPIDVPGNYRFTSSFTPGSGDFRTSGGGQSGDWPVNNPADGQGNSIQIYGVTTANTPIESGDTFEMRLSSDNTLVFSGVITTVTDAQLAQAAFGGGIGMNFRTDVTVREGDSPLDDTDYTVNIVRGDSASVRIEIPTDSINETFTITADLTTDVDLRNDLLTRVQANTAISNDWTVSAQNRTITRNTTVDTGFIVSSISIFSGGDSSIRFRTTNVNVADDPNFAVGNTLLVGHNIYEIVSITRSSVTGGFDYNVRANRLRAGDSDLFNDTIFAITGTEQVEVPVVEFISRDLIDHTIMVSFDAPVGDLSFSQVHLEADGLSTTPSEIRIDFGSEVSPQTSMLILGDNDSDGIANVIAQAVDGHGQLYASRNAPSNVRIEDSQQRTRSLPTVAVFTTGTSGLASQDFTVTEVQAGEPTQSVLGQTLIYTTGASLDATNQWGFFTNTGVNTNPTAWPTGNGIFLRVNEGEFNLANLQTTLNLARQPDTTQQAVEGTTILITVGPVSVGSTEFNQAQYNVVGIGTVSTSNSDLVVELNEINSALLENNVPLDNDLVGLTFARGPFGDINTDIPDHPGNGVPISFSNFYNANDGSNN